MAPSVEHPTLAQVMILQFMGSSPASGSVPTAQSLEPASASVSLSLCPSPARTLSLSLSKINKTLKKLKKKRQEINWGPSVDHGSIVLTIASCSVA